MGVGIGRRTVPVVEARKEEVDLEKANLKAVDLSMFEPYVAYFASKSPGVITALDVGRGELYYAALKWWAVPVAHGNHGAESGGQADSHEGDGHGGHQQGGQAAPTPKTFYLEAWTEGQGIVPHHEAALPTEMTHGHTDARKGFTGFLSVQHPSFDVLRVDFLGAPDPAKFEERMRQNPAFGTPNELVVPGRAFKISSYSEITRVGTGVHVQVSPDGTMVTGADGQKDIVFVWDTMTGQAKSPVFFFKWDEGQGVLTVERTPAQEAYNSKRWYRENGLLVAEEVAPGSESAGGATAVVDSAVWHPSGRWLGVDLRNLGATCIIDVKTWEPVTVFYTSRLVKKHHWEPLGNGRFKMPEPIASPGHQHGFHPSGEAYLRMNTIVDNSIAVFECNPVDDPRKWRPVKWITWKPGWLPFHFAFRPPDGRETAVAFMRHFLKGGPINHYVNLIATPKGQLDKWDIVRTIEVGYEPHSPHYTYDGKYLGVNAGGGRGIGATSFSMFNPDTGQLLAKMPSTGDCHSFIFVPMKREDLLFARCLNT